MKVGLVSLGCPKNLVDSEEMLGELQNAGYTITDNLLDAEIIIVNTCGFIQSAKEESIQTILEMAEYKQKGKCQYLVVAGCLSQRYGKELLTELPEVDGFIGTKYFINIPIFLNFVKGGDCRPLFLIEGAQQFTNNRIVTTPKHYAYLKIAEGCDNCCSYCVIPQIRGSYRSKPYEQVLKEAKKLVEGGAEELILVAQDTTRYGIDLYGKLRLSELLHDLSSLSKLKWIRVLYMYPNSFTDELIETFAVLPKVCKYVDLPLQHASDRLLEIMNRFDTKAEVKSLLDKVRSKIPGVVVRTTFIVGFPGETETDFQELVEFVKEEKFDNAGVFRYSQEEGTVAGEISNQIPDDVKEFRYDQLMSVQAKISEELHQASKGEIIDVVVEGYDDENENLAFGRSYREAPDVDGTVFIENASNLRIGQWVKVKIEQGFTYEVVGSLVEK